LDEILYYIRAKYDLQVYLEPGEAVALNAGWLDTTVLDIVQNGMPILILDASAACHMPDVLEMPYRPQLIGAGEPNEKATTCRLAARTCLAGDVIGDYSFDQLPQIGERLTFSDMAIYSMVKTNTFNGMPLPAIALMREDGDCELVKTFGYEDFKGRLS
jgi:carboxynorspermidine decarboxylase